MVRPRRRAHRHGPRRRCPAPGRSRRRARRSASRCPARRAMASDGRRGVPRTHDAPPPARSGTSHVAAHPEDERRIGESARAAADSPVDRVTSNQRCSRSQRGQRALGGLDERRVGLRRRPSRERPVERRRGDPSSNVGRVGVGQRPSANRAAARRVELAEDRQRHGHRAQDRSSVEVWCTELTCVHWPCHDTWPKACETPAASIAEFCKPSAAAVLQKSAIIPAVPSSRRRGVRASRYGVYLSDGTHHER